MRVFRQRVNIKKFFTQIVSSFYFLPWLKIFAWSIMFFLSIFSSIRLIYAVDAINCITKITAAIPEFVKIIFYHCLIFLEPALEFICGSLDSLGILGLRNFFDARTFISHIDPIFKHETREECFAILGLAGSVIPAVYEAGSNRMRGILISDMTKYFFPAYGFVLLMNLLLSITGRFVEGIDSWVYLLFPIFLTTIYSVTLILATGLSARISSLFVRLYILERSRILHHIQKTQKLSDKNKLAAFLADLSSHIAAQLATANTPHCNTSLSLMRDIWQVVNLIIPLSTQQESEEERPEHAERILNEFDLIFSVPELTDANLANSVYYEMPASESVRKSFAFQIELSSEFWKLALSSMSSQNDRARAACRVFDSMNKIPKKHFGSLTVMTCGMILHLYKESRSAESNSNNPSIDYCVGFAQEMWNTFRSDASFLNNDEALYIKKVSLYAEILFIIFSISIIEQYLQSDSTTENTAKQALDEFWGSAYVHIGRELLKKEHFKKYLALSLCMIRQLPSHANRPIFIAQKTGLQNYAFYQQSRIGVNYYGRSTNPI